MHVIAAKAVAFQEAMQPDFVDYQKRTLQNASTLANELKKAGLRLVSGGTDNHLVLVDLSDTGVNGKQAEESLGRAGIVVNRNTVPFNTAYSPRVTAGMRLGTSAVTSRGFGMKEIEAIARFIVKIIGNIDNQAVEKEILNEVQGICQRFPVPGIDT
jgi:glycine hydroxymethyltransferase